MLDYLCGPQMPEQAFLEERGGQMRDKRRRDSLNMKNDGATSQGMPTATEAERGRE